MLHRVLPLFTALGLGLVAIMGSGNRNLYTLPTFAQSAFTPNSNCSPNVVPIGQQNPSDEPMPMDPIWCFNVSPGPTTRVTGTNDWVDSFQTNTQLQRLNNGDMSYHVIDNATNSASPARTQHFVNNNDWFTDVGNMGESNVAGMLSPNRSFNAENGKLVVEADMAPGVNFKSGGGVFQEIDISQAPAPTGQVVDSLYGHGQFGGAWTIGCRMNGGQQVICAVESSSFNVPDNQASCNEQSPSRIMEISDFEICGSTHGGGSGSDGGYARTCQLNGPYDDCLDRYHIELTSTGLSLYINGQLYFIDSGWDSAHQIPASVMAGPWYVYYTDWVGCCNSGPVYRFDWQRLAVNPHTSTGAPAAASASPTFCLGAPNNTCPDSSPSSATATPVPATPVPATPVPATPTPTAQDFATSASLSSSVTRGTTVAVTGTVRSVNKTTARVTLQVVDPSGTSVLQKVWDNQAFAAGQTLTFNTNWSVPTTAAVGTYTVKIGVTATDAATSVK